MLKGEPRGRAIRPYAVAALGALATVVPPYVVQLASEAAYFARVNSVYFFLSSFRTPFFIIFIGVASFAVGRRSKLALAWGAFALSLAVLHLLLYVGCDPRVCYSSGIDGLEPVRTYTLFLAEGTATMALGGYSQRRLSEGQALAGQAAAYFAIAYYPVMFTMAGTRLLAQLSPYFVLVFLAGLSFVSAMRVVDAGKDRRMGVLVPLGAFLLLILLSLGIAAQYLSEAAVLTGLMLASVAVGSALGTAWPTGSHPGALRASRSKAVTAVMIGIVVLSVVVVTPDAVSATAPGSGPGGYHFLTPVTAGGFNAEPNFVASGAAANFSFRGTDPSSIQPDNYLAAGIGVHSSNCCVDGIDFGYRADVFLYSNGSEVATASAWEVCDTILACGGHTWKHLMYFASARVYTPLNDAFRLSITWANGSALWTYASDGNTKVLGVFKAPAQENGDFDAGWLGLPGPPSPGGYLFFQFGVTSAYPIGRPGWSVLVGCPSTLDGTKWRCVSSAEFFQGDISYWKALWRWGEDYPGVGATVYPANETIVLYYSQASISDFQKAW